MTRKEITEVVVKLKSLHFLELTRGNDQLAESLGYAVRQLTDVVGIMAVEEWKPE